MFVLFYRNGQLMTELVIAIDALMYPLKWNLACIPFLDSFGIDYISSPFPSINGTTEELYQKAISQIPISVCA